MTTNSIISIKYQDHIGNKLEKKFKFIERKWLKELLESSNTRIEINAESEVFVSEIRRRHSLKNAKQKSM